MPSAREGSCQKLFRWLIRTDGPAFPCLKTFTCHGAGRVRRNRYWRKKRKKERDREERSSLTVAGQKSWLEFIESGGDGGGRLIGVRRQFLDVEVRHGHSDLFVDGLNLDGRFQMLRLVLDGRFPPGPHLDNFLLGIDDDFVGEAGLEVDGVAAAAAQPEEHQQSG